MVLAEVDFGSGNLIILFEKREGRFQSADRAEPTG